MIILVTGGRDYQNTQRLVEVLDMLHAKYTFTFLIHGNAEGADKMAHEWCKLRGVQPVAMEALWDYEGYGAGLKRNRRMLSLVEPELCIAFPGGRGTANMMRLAFKAKVEIIDEEDLL